MEALVALKYWSAEEVKEKLNEKRDKLNALKVELVRPRPKTRRSSGKSIS